MPTKKVVAVAPTSDAVADPAPLNASDATHAAWLDADLAFLDPPVCAGPPFPTDLLPKRTGALVKGLATAQQIALDYIAIAVIGASSAAIGNRARVLGYNGRAEPLTLFLAMIGWPASGKGARSRSPAALLFAFRTRSLQHTPRTRARARCAFQPWPSRLARSSRAVCPTRASSPTVRTPTRRRDWSCLSIVSRAFSTNYSTRRRSHASVR